MYIEVTFNKQANNIYKILKRHQSNLTAPSILPSYNTQCSVSKDCIFFVARMSCPILSYSSSAHITSGTLRNTYIINVYTNTHI